MAGQVSNYRLLFNLSSAISSSLRIVYLACILRMSLVLRCQTSLLLLLTVVYGLEGPGFEFWQQKNMRLFSKMLRPGLGSNQPPIQWVPGLQGGCTADYSAVSFKVLEWLEICLDCPQCTFILRIWTTFC